MINIILPTQIGVKAVERQYYPLLRAHQSFKTQLVIW